MAHEDILDRLLRAWREDIDSEPFPAISDVVLPEQTRRQMRKDAEQRPCADWPNQDWTSSTP